MSAEKTKLTREQLVTRYGQIKKQINRLENAEDTAYATVNKYVPGIGVIKEINSQKDLIKALKFFKEQENENLDEEQELAEELGIKLKKSKKEVVMFMGFKISTWISDVKKRAAELTNEQAILDLQNALEVIKRNFNADDLFKLEMSGISSAMNLIDEDIDEDEDEEDYSDDEEDEFED